MFNHPALIELHAEARTMELRQLAESRPSWITRALRRGEPAPAPTRPAALAPNLSRPRSDP